jgi:hypothetical protein
MNKGENFFVPKLCGLCFFGDVFGKFGKFGHFLDTFGREASAEHTHLGQILVAY